METWYIVFLLLLSFITAWISMKTNLLRDDLNNVQRFNIIALGIGKKNPKPPFSLAKTQMAFWTIIILSSFLALYFNGQTAAAVPALTNVSVILLGISAGTTAVGKVIDDSQKDNFRHQNQPSRGLLIDILSDQKGVSIHRLQNVIWNIIVAVIFIWYVFAEKKLPNHEIISDQLLALMGISTGAYLGLKVTENNKTTTDSTSSSVLQELSEDDIPDSYKKSEPFENPDLNGNPIPGNGVIIQKS